MLFKVALASLLNRKLTALLTTLTIAVSVFVLLGVEHIRVEARQSFSKTVSGVDLIVGARTGQINLLLYSVFHIGSATNNVAWSSYQKLVQHPQVAWHVPVSLGDSHKGYRVMGTSDDYFKYFKYAKKQSLEFAKGQVFDDVYDAVIGAEVANKLGYQLNDDIEVSHGVAKISFKKHDDHPFKVVGILKPTGTPVDQSIMVNLKAIEVIHQEKTHAQDQHADHEDEDRLVPKFISAFMLGLKSRAATFIVQRDINNFSDEALLAIIPGVALSELWQMMGVLEKILALIAMLVLVASLLGMITMLLASMKERSREIAVLRAIGAHASFIFLMVELEALLMTLTGVVLGSVLLTVTLLLSQGWISSEYGLFIDVNLFSETALYYFSGILIMAGLLALIPALMAYRSSLARGLAAK
ncbi:MAG: ABC transporter permease [Gammaproteobacteria bacterium]|nr:ABC transporter permease [Gammaproteobacteria bacterium]MCW9057154.1 ABC transporter permease [Gammaproteobacteria bacterium]